MNQDNASPSDPQQPRQQVLNLQNLANQMMQGLQRHFDMLAYNVAARGAVNDESYNARVRAPRFMPMMQAHSNLEQMQAYSHDLMIKQVLADAHNLAATCMNNCHFFCAALKAQKELKDDQQAMQQQTQQTQQKFVQAPMHDKFNALEEGYGIMCPLEDTIISLAFALQIAIQKNGIVSDTELDDSDELRFDLRVVAPPGETGPGQPGPAPHLTDFTKIFRKGDRIDFTADELQTVLITLADFFQSLFRSVEQYGKSLQSG